jgi:glycosyltransferase involved in cell wall biosynthesis
MICFLHGYLLEGSGSNLWTRQVIQSLCRTGHTVHLVCQEPHPERYDFIAEAYTYELNGNVVNSLTRAVPYAGRCIMHKPRLGNTLPVYVWDKYEEFSRVVPMVDLPTHEIESYIERNLAVVKRVVVEHDITVIQANHMVLMSVVAQRTGVPYVIMPHGSALEYAVKPDKRFQDYAREALRDARLLLVSSAELGERVRALFADVMPEVREIRVGVDTDSFHPVERADRLRNIERAIELIGKLPHSDDPDVKLPDPEAITTLRRIDWVNGKTIIYVGRLIEEKGVHHLVDAMPEILARNPNAQLIVVGHGPLRERLRETRGVHFLGYLTHRELSWIMPCCDVGVFPSLVKESGPMVFLEALSSGCFPIATYFAGAKNKIDTVAPYLESDHAEFMKLRLDHVRADMPRAVSGALSVSDQYAPILRQIARAEYDWQPIAAKLAQILLAVAETPIQD